MNLPHMLRALRYGLRWSSIMLGGFLSANRTEEHVAPYTLPDLLQDEQGKRISDTKAWEEKRKHALLKLFSDYVYGVIPEPPSGIDFQIENRAPALNGLALKKEITLFLISGKKGLHARLLLLIPRGEGPHPVILGYNLEGNHTVHRDLGVAKHAVWSKKIPGYSFIPSEKTRGRRAERWPVEKILSRGYAVATLYYGDIEPDYPGASSGIRGKYPELQNRDNNFSALGAWAWGLSRVMDYLARDPDIDASRAALFGFSRAGKAALLAAARDSRFAAVIAAASGKGGAALSRRAFGETIRAMTAKYPHWFSKKLASYADRANELPVDQHMLLALIAPRPLLVSAAAGDWWSDPKGAEAALSAARAAYALYGKEDAAAFYLHKGKHAVTPAEWETYLNFFDRNL